MTVTLQSAFNLFLEIILGSKQIFVVARHESLLYLFSPELSILVQIRELWLDL